MEKRTSLMVILTVVLALASLATAAPDAITIPRLLNYQGKLAGADGLPVPDGSYLATFRLFRTPEGGVEIWSENALLQTRSGVFNCRLGESSPLTGVPEDGSCYLEVQVAGEPPMTPRVQITSAAYAYLAANSDQVDGYHASELTGMNINRVIRGYVTMSGGNYLVTANFSPAVDPEKCVVYLTGPCSIVYANGPLTDHCYLNALTTNSISIEIDHTNSVNTIRVGYQIIEYQ